MYNSLEQKGLVLQTADTGSPLFRVTTGYLRGVLNVLETRGFETIAVHN